MKYLLFSILTAAIAYAAGCLSTMVIASNFVFRTNLRRLGRGGKWLASFRRVYGVKGFLKLAMIELVKDALPVMIGGWLFSSGGNAEVGRALALFCLVLGRCFPSVYGFRGSYATAAICIGAMFLNFSAGLMALVVCVAVTWLTRYIALGTLAEGIVLAVAGVLTIDNPLAVRLCFFVAVIVLIRTAGALARIASGREERLNFKTDISYKFDEKL
ncbi:MAG: glycerol-3-phosphate acyltransferase [Oscillospiraceae bacterium]|nr:glycerol-3-phosphate acyltransferase [Oscillospiraceae bacterium]